MLTHALGLSAPRRAAEAKLAEGQGAAPTSALEKSKRKRVSSTAAPKKKSRILDEILRSPLRSRGDSEDDLSEDSNHPFAEAPPFAAEKVPPLKVVPPSLDLEFSTAQESDDDDGRGDEDQIEVDSPCRSPAARETDTLGHDTKAASQHDTSSSDSRNGGNDGNNRSSS